MPEGAAMTTDGRHPQGIAMRRGVRLYGLQGAKQDAGPGGTGTARDADGGGGGENGPHPVRSVQPICAAVAVSVT